MNDTTIISELRRLWALLDDIAVEKKHGAYGSRGDVRDRRFERAHPRFVLPGYRHGGRKLDSRLIRIRPASYVSVCGRQLDRFGHAPAVIVLDNIHLPDRRGRVVLGNVYGLR
jgi:hypothetical protein